MSDITIRTATTGDIDVLVEFRAAMFRDMGWTEERRLDELRPIYRAYLSEHLVSGDFLGWIAETADGAAVGSVGLLWERVPPTVRNLSGRQAYVLALYVERSHRRRGLGERLASLAVEHARTSGADVISLHATDEGRGVYRRMGFSDSPEMRLFTEPSAARWAPKKHTSADDAD